MNQSPQGVLPARSLTTTAVTLGALDVDVELPALIRLRNLGTKAAEVTLDYDRSLTGGRSVFVPAGALRDVPWHAPHALVSARSLSGSTTLDVQLFGAPPAPSAELAAGWVGSATRTTDQTPIALGPLLSSSSEITIVAMVDSPARTMAAVSVYGFAKFVSGESLLTLLGTVPVGDGRSATLTQTATDASSELLGACSGLLGRFWLVSERTSGTTDSPTVRVLGRIDGGSVDVELGTYSSIGAGGVHGPIDVPANVISSLRLTTNGIAADTFDFYAVEESRALRGAMTGNQAAGHWTRAGVGNFAVTPGRYTNLWYSLNGADGATTVRIEAYQR